MSGVHRVIVGASRAPGCLPALRYAARVAQLEEAPLIAVYAWLPPGGDLAERRYPSQYLRKLWADAAWERLTQTLEAAWGAAVPAGLEAGPGAEGAVVRGEPGPVLVDVARYEDDLLVVGAGRRGALGRVGHGRVSRYCMARARCPVVAVPPADLGRAAGRRGRARRRRELTPEQAMAGPAAAEPGPDRRAG